MKSCVLAAIALLPALNVPGPEALRLHSIVSTDLDQLTSQTFNASLAGVPITVKMSTRIAPEHMYRVQDEQRVMQTLMNNPHRRVVDVLFVHFGTVSSSVFLFGLRTDTFTPMDMQQQHGPLPPQTVRTYVLQVR